MPRRRPARFRGPSQVGANTLGEVAPETGATRPHRSQDFRYE